MRLNRGILILALVAIPVAIANVFATIIFYVLFLCFDTCPAIGSYVQYPSPQGFFALLAPSLLLFPALALILATWIWMIRELRRMGAGRLRVVVILVPLITLILGVAVTITSGLVSTGSLTIYPFDMWNGSFALALWPLLMALVAWRWRAASTVATPTGSAPV